MRLAVLFTALLAFPAIAAEPVALPHNEMIEWAGYDGEVQHFTSDDLTLTLSVTGDDFERLATLTVEKPGEAAVDVTGLGAGAGYGTIGVFPFDDNGLRSVIFATFSGGAHCCMQTQAVTETAGGLVAVDVVTIDGDILPEDLDGDGVYELPIRDDRFNYTFDAYAFSFAPPKVLKSKDGVVYDASADPRFRPLFETAMAEARADCSGDTWNLGPCAGLLAIAARFGTYDQELAPILAALDAGKRTSGWDEFSFCSNADCSETKVIGSFAEAIDYALRDWGYLPAAH